MIPILYEGNETEFLTNGIGRLSDAISCTVEENLNGLYELEMQYPITGIHYGDIETDRLILATPFDGGDPQPFRIYQISRALNGIVTINAEHISYLLNRVVVMPFQAASLATALEGLKNNAANNCPFTFSTTKSGSNTFTVSEPQPLRGLLGGQSGSILDVYGKGEYEFDRWTVKLSTSRGSDQGVTLRYGKNITELVRDSNISNAYTGIVPFWADADGDLVVLPEKIIWSTHRDAFAHEIIKAVDFSSEWQDIPTIAQLRARATAYVTANEGWKLNDNIKVSFVALWQTEEYKNIAVLERVHMGDTVTVIYEALGVESSAKVIRTVYDVLLERFDEIELGTAKNTLAQAIADPILEEVPSNSDMEQAIAHGTKLITGGLGGYVYMKPNASGQPEEILVMDDPDYTQATKLWRFNKNGIGFSKTGYNGEYKYAWTMDGAFYTDWVSAGKMTANLIKTGKITGQESGSMTIDVDAGTITLGNSNKLRITAGNFQLDSSGNVTITGKITATSGSIAGFNISNSANGNTSANGGHIYSKSLWGHSGDGTYEYEIGLKNDTSDSQTSGSGFLGFYIKRITKGARWDGTNENMFYVRHDGYLYAQNANVKGTIHATGGTFSGNITSTGIISGGEIRQTVTNGNSHGFDPIDNTGTIGSIKDGVVTCGALTINKGASLYAQGADALGYDGIYTEGHFATEGPIWIGSGDHNYDEMLDVRGGIWCRDIIVSNPGSISDRQFKDNIEDINEKSAEAFILGLKPVSYVYTDEPWKVRHGFIAQDVREIAYDNWGLVSDRTNTRTQIKYLTLSYQDIMADMVSVIQKQHKRIDELEERLARIEALLSADLK